MVSSTLYKKKWHRQIVTVDQFILYYPSSHVYDNIFVI